METRSAWLRQQLRELIREKEGPLLRYTMRFTGELERARDIVQEAFLRMCSRTDQQLTADLAEARLAAWLFTVCRNSAIDVKRKEHRMHALDSAQMDAYPSHEASASKQLEQQEHLHQMQDIIQTLPTNQREIIHLKFQEGLSYKEISEITSLSVSHVGVLIHKAVKAIRFEMTRIGQDTEAVTATVAHTQGEGSPA